jgi:hypothetical protein
MCIARFKGVGQSHTHPTLPQFEKSRNKRENCQAPMIFDECIRVMTNLGSIIFKFNHMSWNFINKVNKVNFIDNISNSCYLTQKIWVLLPKRVAADLHLDVKWYPNLFFFFFRLFTVELQVNSYKKRILVLRSRKVKLYFEFETGLCHNFSLF